MKIKDSAVGAEIYFMAQNVEEALLDHIIQICTGYRLLGNNAKIKFQFNLSNFHHFTVSEMSSI